MTGRRRRGGAGHRAGGHHSFKNPWLSNCFLGRESFYQGKQEQEPLKPSVRGEAETPPDSRVVGGRPGGTSMFKTLNTFRPNPSSPPV